MSIKEIEKWLNNIVLYLTPVFVFLILLLVYNWILKWDDLQWFFAWAGLNLLVFLLFIKPLYVIADKYFESKKWWISEIIKFILKWWIQNPILTFLKELIINLIYSISGLFLKYRRLLWILTFRFIFLHLTLLLIIWNNMWIGIFSNISETFVLIGYIWIVSLFVWFLTSNNFSMKVLWKYWKTIQQIAYVALLAGALHSSMREWEIWNALAIIVIFWILKVFERWDWKIGKNKINKENIKNESDLENFKERKCNPCWYIYNESLGDPEWGIAPGTKREDIPDNWKCPICGVGKEQFTMIVKRNSKKEYIKWKIINRKMLTKNVLELSVEFDADLKIKPWQRIWFVFEDEKWEFVRAYSIAYHENENNLTDCIFNIKLLDDWRWSKKLREMKIWDSININWVFGHFVLNENTNEKIFIATWTWLAPIINMIKKCDKSTKKTLIFGTQYKNDIFYEEDIKKIINLQYKIFLSREEVDGYGYGRIDLDKFELNNNMEFYICGAPPVVKSMLEYLKLKWFDKIYYEQFF